MSDQSNTGGNSMNDLVSTNKGGVQNLSLMLKSITNAFSAATTTLSPKVTPFNNLGITATALIGTSTVRHGFIAHNPGTTIAYIYPSYLTTAPTTAQLGGAFMILPGADRSFPSSMFQNVNCGWGGFVQTGSNQPLTIVEFY